MKNEMPSPEKVLGVVEAFRWLCGQEHHVPAQDVLLIASNTGILETQESGQWNINDACIKSALTQAQDLPDDPELLAKLIHGIGEIAARCHEELMPAMQARLTANGNANLMSRVLDVLMGLTAQENTSYKFEEISLVQSVKRNAMSWDTFVMAISMINRCHTVTRGRYGLKFVVRLALKLDTEVFLNWFDLQEEHPILATIVDSFHEVFCFGHNQNVVLPLLASSNDFIRCYAAATIVSPQQPDDQPLRVKDCWQTLVDNSIPPGDASWMAGFLLKQSIHHQYSLSSVLERDQIRLKRVKDNPDLAVGGIKYSEHEIESLGKSLKENSSKLSRLKSRIEQMLTEMAECWPTEGLLTSQMQWLENVFVDTAEFRYRLGEKLTHSDNRNCLFKSNIGRVLQLIGTDRDFDDVTTEYFGFHAGRHDDLLLWGAKSLLLRWEGNAGRRLGSSIQDFVENAEAFLDAPLSYPCSYEKWVSTVGRLSTAHLFAFYVIGNTPDHRKSEVARIPEFALGHVQFLLREAMDQWNLYQKPLSDELAQTSVWFMQKRPELAGVRQEWIGDNSLPDFPRALVLWSDVQDVRAHSELAKELFSSVVQRPLCEKENGRYFNRLLSLIDLSVATCWQADDSELLECLVELWKPIHGIWADQVDECWLDAAKWLVEALSGEGEERSRLLEDPGFTRSYCRQLLSDAMVA